MTPGDKICLRGEIVGQEALLPALGELVGANYICQDIHTLAHRPYRAARHLELAAGSLHAIYGVSDGVPTVGELEEAIERLLRENSYPRGSNIVRLRMLPGLWMASCERQSLYEGFVLWHSRPAAIAVRYELSFPGHQCAATQMCAAVADSYAVRCGAAIALRSVALGGGAEALVGPGDTALVGIRDRVGWLTPVEYGAIESVWRDTALETCARAGIELRHEPIVWGGGGHETVRGKEREAVGSGFEVFESIGRETFGGGWDEMMLFTPLGVTSLKSLDGKVFYNTSALKASMALPNMTL
ncbi:MAG: hypothetical protein LBH06_08500 [Rikenellaceae bacterium]|jgi:hypothetical protein|nr:hypothetical protein [Rikenellaceae bacterium]